MTTATEFVTIAAVLAGALFFLASSGGIAALLLLQSASDMESVIDVALTLVVLAAFASVVFIKAGTGDAEEEPRR